MRVLITGASGLIGSALFSNLDQSGIKVIPAMRKATTSWGVSVGDLNGDTRWDHILNQGIDVVVHLAGLTSEPVGKVDLNSTSFYRTNTLGTVNLIQQCARWGVKRFIFASTVKVFGEGRREPFRGDELPMPIDDYSMSKWKAEQQLWKISAETGIEVVILRPPLVYGPGVKGNFYRLLQAIDSNSPLPFGAVHNRRSLVYLGNLVDVICLCLTHPSAAGETFLVSDGDDKSTPDLIRGIAGALDRQPFLLSVPVGVIRSVGLVLGRQKQIESLIGSLTVDIEPLRSILGWRPRYLVQDGLTATAQWYLRAKVRA